MIFILKNQFVIFMFRNKFLFSNNAFGSNFSNILITLIFISRLADKAGARSRPKTIKGQAISEIAKDV